MLTLEGVLHQGGVLLSLRAISRLIRFVGTGFAMSRSLIGTRAVRRLEAKTVGHSHRAWTVSWGHPAKRRRPRAHHRGKLAGNMRRIEDMAMTIER